MKLSFNIIFFLVRLTKAALFDPLNATQSKYPDYLHLLKEFNTRVSELRAQDSRYQHLFDYKLNSLQWKDGNDDSETEDDTTQNAHCLHFGQEGGDNLLQNLRVAYLQEVAPTRVTEELSKVSRLHDHFRVTIPNVGVYDSLEAAAEYHHISIGTSNDGFSVGIKVETVEETPNFASRDTMVVTLAELRDWNSGALIGTNLVTFEFQFRPCSVALDGATVTFDDASIEAFRDQRFSNRYLCERIMGFCTGGNQQYDSMEDCIDFLGTLPEVDPACDAPGHSAVRDVYYSLEGNTATCRFLHHFMAAPDFSPDLHCPHLGKQGGPDPNQEFKCSSKACAAKKEGVVSIDSLAQLPQCHDNWKEEAELALLAVLPMCMEAAAGNRCTPECRQALVQFGLAGYKQSADYANANRDLSLRTRSCICSEELRHSARSSVLNALEISSANLLATCGIMAPPEERTTKFDTCEELVGPTSQLSVPDIEWSQSDGFLKEVVEDIVDRSLASIETSSEVSEEEKQLESESLLMDMEYIKAFAGDNFYHLLPDSARKTGCPFFHGPAIFSYDQVLEVLNTPQKRARTNGLFNIDVATDEGVPHEALPIYSTGSVEHSGLRAAFLVAFPVLSQSMEDIKFPPLPKEILEHSLSDLLSSSLSSHGSAKGSILLQSLMRYALQPLFPKGSTQFLNTLSSTYVEWLSVTEPLTTHTNTWHRVAGEGRLRIFSLYMKRASKMMASYFGPAKMEYFASLTNFTKSGEDISKGWARDIYTLGFVFVTMENILRQIGQENPCEQANMFREDPQAYILEVLRMGNNPLAGNAVIPQGESTSIQHNGKEVVYTGGVQWKKDQSYAVLYSLQAANNDETVFPHPHVFDPSRPNLKTMTLSFGAPEATFRGIASPQLSPHAGARGCLAHNYALSLLSSTVTQLLEKESFCYHRQYQESYRASVVLVWILACAILVFQLGIWTFLRAVAKPHLRTLRAGMTIKASDAFEEAESSYLSQSFRANEDFAKRKLSLRSITLTKGRYHKSAFGRRDFAPEKQLLEGVSLDLPAGRVTGLMGESGAGKSSLLNTIARFHNDPGLLVSGSIVESCDEGKRKAQGGVSYVHHDHKVMLFDDLTAFENLVVGALVRMKKGFEDDTTAQAIRVLVEGMKLHKCLDTPVKHMSSGEKRRLSIAVECLRPSRILLLDEPLSGLDSAVALETMQYLRNICRKFHKIVVVIVHAPSHEAFALLDDLIVMKAGRCLFSGPRTNAFEQLGIRKSLAANPADALMEHVANMNTSASAGGLLADEEEEQTRSVTDTAIDSPPPDEESGNSVSTASSLDHSNNDRCSSHSEEPATPFAHRFLACTLVHWMSWRRSWTVPVALFVAIPVAVFFLALYNVGPNTQPHEAIAMTIMLIACPSCLMVQATATPKVSRLFALVHMKRFGLYSGMDYALHLLLFYGFLSIVMVLLVYTSSLYVGLAEILTLVRYWEIMAVALALHLSVVALDLALNLAVSRPGLSEHQFYSRNNHACSTLMVFLCVGVVLSGLLYRTGTTGVPYLYDVLSYLSPPFWAGLAMVVSLLDGAVFSGCSENNALLLCLGDTYLLNYGLEERSSYIPGFSIWFLLLVTSLAVLGCLWFGYRPLENKPMRFVQVQHQRPKKTMAL